MNALERLIAVIEGLPMDAEGRRAADELIAAARAEHGELIDALRGCVAQLSPGSVPVVIQPHVEPFSIAVARRIVDRYPDPETAVLDDAPSVPPR